jgi:hypothetical protein
MIALLWLAERVTLAGWIASDRLMVWAGRFNDRMSAAHYRVEARLRRAEARRDWRRAGRR